MVLYENHIYRYTQDDTPTYGNQVHAFEITKLTTTEYQEKAITPDPIIKASGEKWNAVGMHNVSPCRIKKNKWIEVILNPSLLKCHYSSI